MLSNNQDRPGLGIAFICVGIFAISINDMLIKLLSGGYPLHQIVAIRSAIGLIFSLTFVHFSGGFRILLSDWHPLHILRGFLVVIANMTFYAAVAVMPLGQATALFFVAPLFITLLSIPLLGESVGPWRIGAVIVGFLGVVVMQQPWASGPLDVARGAMLLPVLAALMYALMQVLTRKLGVKSRAAAMAVYTQGIFLLVSLGFFILAGDGRFAEGVDNESVQFLLRAWVVPPAEDLWTFVGLGCASGVIGYSLSAAYRIANAATIAPFEYLGLPLAIFWGWALFQEWPSAATWAGCALIVGAGLVVFLREQLQMARPKGWRQRPFRR